VIPVAKYSMKELVEKNASFEVWDDESKSYVNAKVLTSKFPGVEVKIGKRKEVIGAMAHRWLKVTFDAPSAKSESVSTRKRKKS
jgi:hypothetical protein